MNDAQLLPQMAGNTHVLPIRIYYEDTDAGGVVFYANYLRFAERARTEMMRRAGYESSKLIEERGLVIAVHHAEIDYKRPGRLDDLVQVHSTITRLGGASVTFRQTVMRDDVELAEMSIRVVCMTMDGKTHRLPDDVRAAFQQFTDTTETGEE